MKKLISILMALCLLCVAVAALAEAETPSWDKMPLVVTVEEGTELTDADFEGEWVVDKVFVNEIYMTPAEVEENGLALPPMRIAEGKIFSTNMGDDGEKETAEAYTLENNQILFKDASGLEAVFEKLEDGNIVMSLFLPSDGETPNCVSFFMVHPAN